MLRLASSYEEAPYYRAKGLDFSRPFIWSFFVREELVNFLKYDLGSLQRGEIVEITLKRSANVRLMSSSDFSNYKNGRRHRYIGGLARQSPVRLQIPNSGHWFVAVDMQGLQGSTSASVRVVPGALPEIREAPLTSAPSLVRETPPGIEHGGEVNRPGF